MKRIHDIVKCSKDTAFRNDVQLGWFQSDSQENIQLVKSYIFSKQSFGDRKSPVDILKMIRDAYLVRPPENRYLVIATFGHGKSHLALAAANYFGHPGESPEVQALLSNIEKAYDGPSPEANSFADFKRQRNHHLVLCLNGTKFIDLQQAFLSELKSSLSATLGTEGVNLPFWFGDAEKYFTGLGQTEIKRLDRFLDDKELDHASLLGKIKSQDQSVHHICLEAVRHLVGITPNWESHVNLAETVTWLVENYCGSGKQFTGVLILFDEFSAFVRSYSKRSTPGSPLQDLLDGVFNNRQKVVFTAFAQYDPAGWVQSMTESQSKEVLLTELERIPKTHRFFLFNTMETILDSFLVQENGVLDKALDEGGAWSEFQEANTRVHLLFQKRYETELHWNVEAFEKIVSRGCFPLHPATTALLCNIEFQEVGNARTVLGYVLGQVQNTGGLPATVNSRPNWVPATSIAEFFANGEVADEEWKQYKQALITGGGDITNEQHHILRALLLWTIAKLPTRHVKQTQAISDFAGVELASTAQTLKDLAESHVVSFDEITSKYSFFPPGGGNAKAIELIKQKRKGRTISWADVINLNHKNHEDWALSEIANGIPWGSGADWASTQFLLPAEYCRPDKVKAVLDETTIPGAVFWLCAKTESDLQAAVDSVQATLDQVAGQPSKPITFVIPSRPSPVLFEKLLDQLILADLTPTQEQEFGTAIMATIKTQVKKTITEEITSLRQNPQKMLAPSSMHLALNARPEIKRISAFTFETVKLAYHSAPPYFFDQYKQSHPKLKRSTLLVARFLLENRIDSGEFGNDPIATQIVDKYLVSGNPTSWCVLNTGRHIQRPGAIKTAKAWDLLDSKIAPGEKEFFISKALEELKGIPYGYDSNTLSLLFSTWLGFYRYDIQISVGGALKPADYFVENIKRIGSPEEFVAFLMNSKIAIKRKDRGKEDQRIRTVLQRISNCQRLPYSMADALRDLALLSDFANYPGNAERDNLQDVKNGLKDLQQAIKAANTYDTEATGLRSRADEASTIQEFVSICKDATKLSTPIGVTPSHLQHPQLVSDLQGRLEKAVESHCAQYGKLTKLEDFGRNENELSKPKSILTGYPNLLQKIEAALDILQGQKAQVENEQRDAVGLATLNAFTPSRNLSAVRTGVAAIQPLKFCLPKNQSLKEDKLRKYQELETDLIDYINLAYENLAKLQSSNTIQSFVNDIRTRLSQYDGTDERQTLVDFLAKCERCANLFSQFDQKTAAPKDDPDSLHDSVHGLSTILKEGSGLLSQQQIDTIKAKCDEREALLRKKKEEALSWLSSLEKLARSDTDWLKAGKEFSTPHPFLSATEKTRLQNIRVLSNDKLTQKNEQDQLAEKDKQTLLLIDKQSRTGSVEELESRLQLIDSLEVHLEISKKRKDVARRTIEDAVTKARAERELMNSRREDQQKLAAITPGQNQTLVDLRRVQHLISNSQFALAENRTKATEISSQVDQAIKKHLTFASCLGSQLNAVTTPKELNQVTEEIQKKRFQYAETPELTLIDTATTRADRIREFFQSLTEVKSANINTPQEAAELNIRIQQLLTTFDGDLSQTHKEMAKTVEGQFQEKVQKLSAEADTWLQMKSNVTRIEELLQLLNDLESPPAFLQSNKIPLVEALKQKALSQLDGNEVNQVIHHFQKITDATKRRETVARLQELV